MSPSWEPGEAGHRCPKGHTTQKGRLLGAHSTQYCLPQKLIGTLQVTGRRGHTWTSRGTGVLFWPTQGEGSFSQDLAVDSDGRGTGGGAGGRGGGGSLWCPGIEESRWLRPLTHPLFSPFSLPHKFLRRAPPSSLRPKLIIPSCVWYFFPGGIFCFSSKGQSSPRV